MKYIKYSFKEMKRNASIMLLAVFQSIIVFAMIIAMVSMCGKKYEKYSLVKNFIDSKGVVFHSDRFISEENGKLLSGEELEKKLVQAKCHSLYTTMVNMEKEEEKRAAGLQWIYAYDDSLIDCYTPELEEGRWLQAGSEKDYIEAVIFQKDKKYQLGKTYPIYSIGEKALKEPVQIKVVGILKDQTEVISFMENDNYAGMGIDSTGVENYRIFFQKINKLAFDDGFTNNDVIMYTSKKNLDAISNQFGLFMSGLTVVEYDKDITAAGIQTNEEVYNQCAEYYCKYDMESLRAGSIDYILLHVKEMIPVLIAMVLFMLLSTVSCQAILCKQNRKTYSIYYVNGLTWRGCIYIRLWNVIFIQFGSLLISIGLMAFLKKIGVLASTNIYFGKYQVVFCFMVIVLVIFCSILISSNMLQKKSAKDILIEAV